eukprot:4046088-Prymnesium_polylepis.1
MERGGGGNGMNSSGCKPGGQTDAPAAAPEPSTTQAMELMEMPAHDEQPTSAAPCVAAAAEPHKRRAVAAGTAVEA